MARGTPGSGYGRDGSGLPPARDDRDYFRDFLVKLPDDIARVVEESGRPFVVELPAAPDPASARLLAALGVEWTVV